MRICPIYFSGTRTTEKVIKVFSRELMCYLSKCSKKFYTDAVVNNKDTDEPIKVVGSEREEKISEEVFDITPLSARKNTLKFSNNDIVIIGMPTIAGRVPNLLLPFLNTIEGNGAMGIPIVLYGNRDYDDSLIELGNIMKERGFRLIGAGAFIGEHSFSELLAKGRPDNSDMRVVNEFAKKVCDVIMNFDSFGELDIPGCEPLRAYFTPRDRYGNKINFISIKPITDMNLCDDCKICSELCPLGSIDYDDVSNITGKCMKCCACIKRCPRGAKYFDDEGYIYHMKELEEMYMDRKEPEYFLPITLL